MSDAPYEARLHGAWLAIQEIKDEPDEQFWELFDGIRAELLDGMQSADPDEPTVIQALMAYAHKVGKITGEELGKGYV